jgi:hypothetical protein
MQVEHRGLGGLDREPGFGPAVPARSGRDTTTDPQGGRPALQDDKPPPPGGQPGQSVLGYPRIRLYV